MNVQFISPLRRLIMQIDEYVILDKITRFRQDMQMSDISKIVAMLVKV